VRASHTAHRIGIPPEAIGPSRGHAIRRPHHISARWETQEVLEGGSRQEYHTAAGTTTQNPRFGSVVTREQESLLLETVHHRHVPLPWSPCSDQGHLVSQILLDSRPKEKPSAGPRHSDCAPPAARRRQDCIDRDGEMSRKSNASANPDAWAPGSCPTYSVKGAATVRSPVPEANQPGEEVAQRVIATAIECDHVGGWHQVRLARTWI
jgi:hypothetical protein